MSANNEGGAAAPAAGEGVSFAELDPNAVNPSGEKIVSQRDLEAVYDVPVKVQAVLGATSMPVKNLLRLGRGAVIDLDRKVGEPVDIYVNNRLVARGEVVVVDDRLGITMTEIIKSEVQQAG
ncbi:MAG: flagellar motor switch protein FliN [Bdellovibrionales bacterium]